MKKIYKLLVLSLTATAIQIAPAQAALLANTTLTTDAITVTTPAPTTTVGTTVSTNVTVSFTVSGNGALFGAVQVALTKPAASSITLADRSGATGGAIVDPTTGITLSTSSLVTNSVVGDQVKILPANVATPAATANTDNILAFTLNLTPDAPGTYVVTLTGTTLGNPATSAPGVTATYTLTVSGNLGSSAILKSASGSRVLVANTLTCDGTATLAVGGGLAGTSADVGKSIWTNEGFIGTIATFGSATAATLAAVCPTRAAVAAAYYTGTLAATTTADGIVTGQISGMTVAVGADAGINISLKNLAAKVGPGPNSSARVKIGSNVISGAITTQLTTDTNLFVPITAPTTAGTYTAVVSYSNAGTFLNTAADQLDTTFTLTVTAASGYSNSLSQAFIKAGNTTAVGDATSDLLPVAVSKTAVAANAGKITINAFDATGAAMLAPGTVTVTVSGSGALSSTFDETTDTSTINQCSATTNARVVTFTADAVNNVILCADGTAGVGTYTVSVTNAAGVTTTLATKTVTFFGSVAKLVATPIFTIGTAGGGTTGTSTAARALTSDSPAVVVKATDSAGNVVSGLTITALSSDLTVVNSAITSTEDNGTSALTSGGAGFYNASFSTPSSAASGKTATLTFRILDPADVLGVAFLTSAVTLTIGGAVATEVLSFDKTAYAPGEAMVVTITAKDSAGNPVADGTASPAITFSKAVGGTAIGTSVYVGGKKATSATAPTVFAPTIAGAFSALATSTNTAKSAITAASSVTDANSAVKTQIDALNAKIVALNALIAKIMKKLGVK
jgi:filamentous hemagglutinin